LSVAVTNLSVLVPEDVEALAAMLRRADSEGTIVAPRGGGTKWSWGALPRRLDAVISTERLNTAIEHCAGDLTATVPAGATLRDVNTVLARAGQWLPLDPPLADRATIGGIIATNDSGPRRHKHGAPRDLILGIDMIRADGQLARAGGRVVKNVSGYDLARMMCGSLGTLAVFTRATFKLSPIAPASRTVVARTRDARLLSRLALEIAAAPLAASAIELQTPANRLLVRFDSTEGAADRQAAAVGALCDAGGAEVGVANDATEHTLWQEHERIVWDGSADAVVVKLSVLPTVVGDLLERGATAAAENGVELRAIGRAALGVLYFRLSGPAGGPARGPARGPAKAGHYVRVIEALRQDAAAAKGSASVVSAPDAVRAAIDPWGEIGSALPVMRAVKARFDPRGTLSDRFGF
jgi:glycolate dehydrogenase FAD-binding subunit